MAYSDLTIEVAVDVLLTKLRTNRDKHLKAYETAKKGWAKLLKRELETKLRVLAGEPQSKIRPYKVNGHSEALLGSIVNQKPTNYLRYYDQAIEMLEFALDQTIKLDSEQYQQYIKDEWNWKGTFTTSNEAYAAAARK